MNNNEIDKKLILPSALLAGYIGEHIEYMFSIFLHDLTCIEVIEADLTSGINAALITNTISGLIGDKLNLISRSILSVGLTYALIAMYDIYIDNKDVDFEDTTYRFIYDSIFIILIMYLYNKLLNILKEKKKRTGSGLVYKTLKNVIQTLPISLYFGYRQFVNDLKANEDNQDNKDKQDYQNNTDKKDYLDNQNKKDNQENNETRQC